MRRSLSYRGRPAGAALLSYSLGYTFALGDGARLPPAPFAVTPTGAHMTTVTDVDFREFLPRSSGPCLRPKCLYLWRCGGDWNWWRKTD